MATPPGRQAVELDVGGTLSVDASEGTVTSGTVTIYDEAGTVTSVSAAAATVSSPTLSYDVGPTVVDTVGRYRARWEYLVSGDTYHRDQLFDVVRQVLRPTLTPTRLTTYYAPILAGRAAAQHQGAIDLAWAEVLASIRALDKNPHRIIDPEPLEQAHAHFAAAVLMRSASFGSASTSEWQAWAADQQELGRRALSEALAVVDWYDVSDDLVPGEGETSVRIRQVEIGR